MGCDIHAYVERKQYDQWWQVAAVKIGRDYRLFALLAGVRNFDNGLEPVVAPRDLPDDLCMLTAAAYNTWGSDPAQPSPDWHTPSWLTLDELETVSARYTALDAASWPLDMQAVMAMMGVYDEARLVFWFDN